MAAVDKYRGQDIPINVTCSVSIDDLSELYVYVIHRESRTIEAQFNKAGSTGYTALTKVTVYKYQAIFSRADTDDAQLGMYDLDVKIIQTDADFLSSEKHSIAIEEVFNLKESYSKIIT